MSSMTGLKLDVSNKFVSKMLFARFGGRSGYLEYQKQKKIAEAMADNEAKKIQIAGEIEQNLIREELKLIESLEIADRFAEYKNLYSVLTRAVPKIQYDGDEARIDIDKVKRLKDLSKEFASEDMQEYIAGILAGEYNKPGSYSLKTMEIMRSLSKEDINLFMNFGGIILDGTDIFGQFFGVGCESLKTLKKKGILYKDYLYLQELGLFTGSDSATPLMVGNYDFWVGKTKLKLFLDKEIRLTHSLLTKSGQELYTLINPVYDEELVGICKDEFIRQGFKEI